MPETEMPTPLVDDDSNENRIADLDENIQSGLWQGFTQSDVQCIAWDIEELEGRGLDMSICRAMLPALALIAELNLAADVFKDVSRFIGKASVPMPPTKPVMELIPPARTYLGDSTNPEDIRQAMRTHLEALSRVLNGEPTKPIYDDIHTF